MGEGPGSDQPVWSEPDEDFEDGLPLLGDDDDARRPDAIEGEDGAPSGARRFRSPASWA